MGRVLRVSTRPRRVYYNVALEERESGTFALIASQPVAWWRIVLARMAVRAGTAVAVTIVASVGTLAAVGALDGVGLSAVVAWCAAVVAVALLWAGLAALVNAAKWSSAANGAALLVAWLFFAMVIPAVIGEVAHVLVPVPSRVQLITAVRLAGSLTPAQAAALLTAYYEEHPDL